jgi:hypothetical protein
MWQPMTGPRGTSTANQNLPSVTCRVVHVTYQLSASASAMYLLMSSHATCHPYSGDTCHPWIGPTVRPYAKSACHVSPPRAATCHLLGFPCQLYGRTACTVSMPRGTIWTVRTVQSSPFFCLFAFSDRTRYLLHTEPV